MFIRGVAGFTAVFVHQQFDQFPFSGQLILFAHDLQEGDGVGEVEIAEVEALGGGFLGDADAFEEAFAAATLDGLKAISRVAWQAICRGWLPGLPQPRDDGRLELFLQKGAKRTKYSLTASKGAIK